MPVTPFHMGPGVAIKALGGRHFSLMMFGFSQVAIDLEPLVQIIRNGPVLHGFTHSYAGATGIALVSLVVGRPVCHWLMRWWNRSSRGGVVASWQAPEVIPWPAAATGAFIGTYSHVVLDSIMHGDMRPWQPWLEGNGMLGLLSIRGLHLVCLVLGVAGLAVLVFPAAWRKLSRRTGKAA